MTYPSDVGNFVIGKSPIGVDPQPFDWSLTVLSQYANSPVLLALLYDFHQWLDPAELVNNFLENVWDVSTAVGWGLDVWGRIVGVGRVLPATPLYFGFEEAGPPGANPFNQEPFYSGATATDNIILADDAFRQLIYAKAAANLWDGSIPQLNAILRMLCPGQVCYAVDGLNMTLTYYFNFLLTPVQASIVLSSGVLPRPAGVSTSVVQV